RIGSVFTLQAGKNISANQIAENVEEGLYPCFGGNGVRGYVPLFNREGYYPIIGRQGALCGNINLANGQFYATEHAVCVETFANTNVLWCCYFLTALNLNQYATATAQPGLAVANINEVLIPLPPLSEQHRIVAKIEELLPYIERYGKAGEHLTALNTTFPEALKKSILQEAVQGKLVPQNPDDEPASVLLERIRAEKQALIKAGKIRKDKHESAIITRDKIPYEIIDGKERCIADEVPFEIPDSWCWCRLGSIIQIESGKGLTSKQMIEGSIPVYGGNGITGYHNASLVHKETVVIGRVGYYCGSVHITEKEAWVTDNAFITTYPENSIYREYLVYTLRYMNLGQNNNATAQPVVSGKKIYPMLFPLPPLAEQHRIVAKIEEIMPMIERLTLR
ncbi:restriction endonuclease subunit S, partial [Ruminococcus bicirculans]|nr:restriction endonuclease subunit S [Ruminococcus bicirculans (ex Wegman et al. 2014)]